ncbi:hypothetical protein CMI47_11155 [Candidatus Pacearchaeota archaeon]|nr:hypothetical protein [Candidatus Pacearchaeota archaeon]|tara:strand:- start:133 stop:549 length:417 start_codon:yes stop_codon:yes gene_type:complete
MNTKQKGDISVANILASILEYDIPVCVPWGDCQPYDLIVDMNGELLKIQCKTGRLSQECLRFPVHSITTKNGKPIHRSYKKCEVDFFMIYFPDNGKVYCIPHRQVGKDSVFLRLHKPKNNQQKKVKMAQDFEFNGTFK